MVNITGRINRIARRLEKVYGRTRIEPEDPLEVLIRCILSQNTTDRTSLRAFAGLKDRFPTWQKLHDARLDAIEKVIRVGGLARQKADYIRGAVRWVKTKSDRFDLAEIVGDSLEEAEERLLSLKGVGIKTAYVTLLFSGSYAVFPVDTHIHRTLTRLGVLPPAISPEKAHHFTADKVRGLDLMSLHLNLIRLGREVCRARAPDHSICPLRKICSRPGDETGGKKR